VCPGVCAQATKPTAAPPPGANLDAARLAVTGDLEKPQSLSLTDLGGFPRTIVKVVNEHSGKEQIYQGVLLAEILKRAGVPQGQQLRGAALSSYVRAEAADGYSVVFSLAELDSDFADAGALVADTLDGEPIPEKFGPFRLILPHDQHDSRWVFKLRSITVVKTSK
jgi:DMSO/TMAO reductase YedYZ molybdopterin-dependent catalytic subunit